MYRLMCAPHSTRLLQTSLVRTSNQSGFSRSVKHVRQYAQRQVTSSTPCRTPSPVWGCGYKLLTLGFVLPFSMKQHNIDAHAAEVMSNIPKEVFREDSVRKKKRNRNWLQRFLFSLWNYIRTVMRCGRVLCTFGPLLLVYPATWIDHRIQRAWWRLLLGACELTGATYIKLGQWASTRRDLFPDEFCDMFAKLYSSTHTHSWYYTKKKLQRAFGPRWRELFTLIEKKPVGSGAIAQVHKGWLRVSMIPDEELVESVLLDMAELEDNDTEDAEVDYADGLQMSDSFVKNEFVKKRCPNDVSHPGNEDRLEIVGLGHVADAHEDAIDFAVKGWHGIPSKIKQFWANATTGTKTENPSTKENENNQNNNIESENLPSDLASADSDSSSNTEGESMQSDSDKTDKSSSSKDEWKGVPYASSQRIPWQRAIDKDGEAVIPVAIKVLHPDVYQCFNRDLSILCVLVSWGEVLFPSLRWLSMSECLKEFTDLMKGQIDLRKEYQNLQKFIDNFEHSPNIRFPKPIAPYCKRDVLVETFEEGEPILNFLPRDGECDDPNAHTLSSFLAEIGVDTLLQMIFTDNLVHGDLHPGNILVQNAEYFSSQRDANKCSMVDMGDTIIVNVTPIENPVRLILLDTGISTSLAEGDLANLSAVFSAVIKGDGERVADLFLERCRHHECVNKDQFRKDIADIVTEARSQGISLGKIQVSRLLSKVFTAVMTHKVKIESNFVSILLAVFVLEGLGRSLNPQLDIMQRAVPFVI